MNASHTPGPWRWMNDDTLVADYSRRNVVITGGRNGTLQTCGANGRLRQLRVEEPNAHLIAAAPDLLATLTTVVEWFDTWSIEIGPAEQDLLDRVRAAIAKAEGPAAEGV